MPTSVTQLIDSIRDGDADAADSLMTLVYDELRVMAERFFAREPSGHTLQTTALVNETFIRLFGSDQPPNWDNRAHFFGAAAEAMRRILVDHARRKKSTKRGGRYRRIRLPDFEQTDRDALEVLEVHEVLDQLAEDYPRQAELVKLRYFAGMTIEQAAKLLQVSVPTANRDWAFARAWLFARIQMDGEVYDSRPLE